VSSAASATAFLISAGVRVLALATILVAISFISQMVQLHECINVWFILCLLDIWWIFSKSEHCGCLVTLDTIPQYLSFFLKCKLICVQIFCACMFTD